MDQRSDPGSLEITSLTLIYWKLSTPHTQNSLLPEDEVDHHDVEFYGPQERAVEGGGGTDTEQPVPQPNQSQLTNSPEY